MFQISLPNIIVAYLVVTLSILFSLWIASDWFRKRRDKRNRRFRLVCNICGFPYEDRSRDPIPPCPNCTALNERVSLRDL
jgi:hypothetical protein